jgi:branched-chain amino acid transport system substrate-binding protein
VPCSYEYGQPLDTLPNATHFAAKYKATFGTDLLSYAPFAYDATWIAIRAMQAAGTSDPKSVVDALHKTSMDGVTGKIAFNQFGDLRNPVSTLYVVQNEKWIVKPVK